MTTPLVCLLSRPAGAPADSVQLHYQDPALSPQEQASILAWSDRPAGAFPRDQQGQLMAVFHYEPLPSGRLALGRLWQVTTGEAESGETLLLHALVFEPDELPVYPLDYLDWDGWWENLDTPPPPPTAAEPRSPRLEIVRTFLAALPEREPAAILLLAGILSRDRHGRAMLVRDQPEWGPTWMRCIQRLLPLSHALNLGICSHVAEDHEHRPRLNATSPGSALDYPRVQQGEDYFIADLVGRQRSTLPRQNPLIHIARNCASRLVSWAMEQPGLLTEFHAFVAALFRHEALTPELWWMLRLYEASNSEGGALTPNEVEPVLDILGYYTRPEAWEGVMGLLDTLLPQLTQNQRPSDDDALLGLCLVAVHQSSQPGPQQQAFRQWLAMFDRYLLNGQQVVTMMERYREVASLPLSSELHQQLLAPQRLAQLQQQIPSLETSALGAVAWILLDSTLQLSISVDQQQIWLDPILARLLPLPGADEQLNWLLTRTAEPQSSATLLQRAWIATELASENTPAARASLARLLHGHLQAHRNAPALREAILTQAAGEALMLAEWQHQLRSSDAPLACFQNYRQTVLDTLPGYYDRCFGKVCEALFEHLPEEARIRQAQTWLLGDEEDWWRLPDALAGRCVTLVNQQLSLSDNSARTTQLTAQVFARARELGQPLQPDIPLLRRSLEAAGQGELEGDDDWFQETRQALVGLSVEAHRHFLDGILDNLLRQALNPDEHGRILQDLDHPQGILGNCYLAALQRLLKRQDPLAAAVALRFWIRATTPPGIHQEARQCLLKGLSLWNHANLTALGQILDRHCPDPQMSAQHWRSFWRELDEQRQQRIAIVQRRLQAILQPLSPPYQR